MRRNPVTYRHAAYEAEMRALDSTIEILDAVRSGAASTSEKKQELAAPWPVFARRMRLLNPQSSGARHQNYLSRFYGWRKVSQTLDRGDIVTTGGHHVEIKVTTITASNRQANFVQIRIWQDIHGYSLYVIDEEYTIWRFDLTKEQMAEEVSLIGTSAHQTAQAAEGNLNKEFAIRFMWDSDDPNRARWMEKYRVDPGTEPVPSDMRQGVYETAAQIRARKKLPGLPTEQTD